MRSKNAFWGRTRSILQVPGPALDETNPLHHDEIRMFRANYRVTLPACCAQAKRAVHIPRTAGGHFRCGLHSWSLLCHRFSSGRHTRVQNESATGLHGSANGETYHPRDCLSFACKWPPKNDTWIYFQIKMLGFKGLWGGLGTRIIMVGTLTGLQWFIYDGVKVWLGIPRPPPPEVPKSTGKKPPPKNPPPKKKWFFSSRKL